MSKKTTRLDVFISHASGDRELAKYVAVNLENTGLGASTSYSVMESGHSVSERIREKIAEADAFVALITPLSIHNPNVMYELGAAFAWNKKTHLVLNGVAASHLPVVLGGFATCGLADLDTLASEIKAAFRPLSATEEEALNAAYGKIAVPVDKLLRDHAKLKKLMVELAESTDRSISGQTVLELLLRLRKQGRLVPLGKRRKPSGPSASTAESA